MHCGVFCKIHWRQIMEKHSTEFIGLDVHKESTAIGRASAGRAVGRFVGTIGPTLAELLKSLGRPEELSILYEAGPCGYGLVRELLSHGYACEVIAPSKIPRRSGDRVKADRRDAVRLAELARAGELALARFFLRAHSKALSSSDMDALTANHNSATTIALRPGD
jgi:hypothetical protein